MIVDIHTHIIVKEAFKEVKQKFPHVQTPKIVKDAKDEEYLLINGEATGPIIRSLYTAEERIKDMNAEGIDIQVLSVVPFTFFYNLDSKTASAIARAQNIALSKLAEKYPKRFVGLATVPLQDVDATIEELEYAVKNLGLKGVEVGTNFMDKNLDSLELWPFYEKVQELDVPILVHPINPAGAERLRKYYLTNFVGFPFETAITIASLIFSGVLERFPKLKFCFVHAGGFMPYQIGRLDHGYKVRPEAKGSISKMPSEYFKMMYFDTTAHYEAALRYLITVVGCKNVLMGSDYPYDMGDPHPASTVKNLGWLSEEDKENVLGRNASRIFKI
ncbi:MAG: amidohydrolase family protein [Nitrososphaerota archaeon]|nr:amidohydrolase family protein [Nitrososphaerota archaeon]